MRVISLTTLSTSAALAAAGLFGAVSAQATAIPAASFYEYVSGSACSLLAQATDGSCKTKTATASTSGGVFGTPGFDPSTPGTSLQANIFSSGHGTLAISAMVYDFQIAGPANTYVPVDFIDSGILSVVGGSGRGEGAEVLLGLQVTQDFGGHGVLLQHTAGVCTGSSCGDDFAALGLGTGWMGTDRFCVLTGMNYQVAMGAISTASGGAQAYGKIDPVIKVDPPPFDPPQTPVSYTHLTLPTIYSV